MAGDEHHSNFRYDVFLSFDIQDEKRVREIRDQFRSAGLRTFFAPDDLRPVIGAIDSDAGKKLILDALRGSAHLAVYCSTNGLTSRKVREEITAFRKHAEAGADGERRIVVLPDETMSEAELAKRLDADDFLRSLQRPQTISHALLWFTDRQIDMLRMALKAVGDELQQARELARQSFDYYRHARFWKPFSEGDEHNKLHVFTCGRDTEVDPSLRRARRTNIDIWDYQASVDITHHFARHHRHVGVEIEQPVSKEPIGATTRWFDTSQFSNQLADRNCVIIGSPDVSDYAEVALAKLLNVDPYTPDAPLATGFRIIKDGPGYSTFYEATSETAKGDGIRLIGSTHERTYTCGEGRTYGVMVLADNPFFKLGPSHKILILAGHTGVSTRAISLLLTEEERWCLDEFYKLDQAIAVMRGPLAAVIEVNYARQSSGSRAGDGRSIPREPGRIVFKHAIELQPRSAA